jgi:rare lipoprotein A
VRAAEVKRLAIGLLVLATPASGQTCRASYYARGAVTASGERFRPDGLTAAHRSLPFGTRLRIGLGGRAVMVRVNDRGPFVASRCLDLSRGAARALGMLGRGVAMVRVD